MEPLSSVPSSPSGSDLRSALADSAKRPPVGRTVAFRETGDEVERTASDPSPAPSLAHAASGEGFAPQTPSGSRVDLRRAASAASLPRGASDEDLAPARSLAAAPPARSVLGRFAEERPCYLPHEVEVLARRGIRVTARDRAPARPASGPPLRLPKAPPAFTAEQHALVAARLAPDIASGRRVWNAPPLADVRTTHPHLPPPQASQINRLLLAATPPPHSAAVRAESAAVRPRSHP